jgi:deoxyribodipyrimidine photo-lyase
MSISSNAGLPAQRVTALNARPENLAGGKHVVYWMSAAQRAQSNPALEFAVKKSNEHALPLIVLFCLFDKYPEAYERHYAFMLEGLAEVQRGLQQRGIKFLIAHGQAPHPVVIASREASCVITDCGYTRLLRHWRTGLAEQARVSVVEVEGEVVVPTKLLTDRCDTAATFRPRQARHVERFLIDVEEQPLHRQSVDINPVDVVGTGVALVDLAGGVDVDKVLSSLDLDRSVPRVCAGGDAKDEPLRGGTSEALRHLEHFFLASSSDSAGQPPIVDFAEQRNNASKRKQSHLSPYLHFGQISPVAAALRARKFLAQAPHHRRDVDVFWDELVVRREFAVHFVLQHPGRSLWSMVLSSPCSRGFGV